MTSQIPYIYFNVSGKGLLLAIAFALSFLAVADHCIITLQLLAIASASSSSQLLATVHLHHQFLVLHLHYHPC